jgi:hypothetical protein
VILVILCITCSSNVGHLWSAVLTTCSVLCLLDEHTAFVFRVTELVAVDVEVMELPTIQEANQG